MRTTPVKAMTPARSEGGREGGVPRVDEIVLEPGHRPGRRREVGRTVSRASRTTTR